MSSNHAAERLWPSQGPRDSRCGGPKEDVTDSEELIQEEVESIAEDRCGAGYCYQSPELQLRVRLRATDLLWPADVRQGFVAAA
jgi:hypothetical protein